MSDLVAQVKDMVANPYAWPGGYTKTLFMSDGECLCHKCTSDNIELITDETTQGHNGDWKAAQVYVHWEGEPIQCGNCNADIDSEYGEIDSE